VQKWWTDLNDLYMFLCYELPFSGLDDCISVKIFTGINFLNRD